MSGRRSSRPGGIVCPLVTPLTDAGRLDEPVFRALIDALVPDLDGLFILGSSGELTWLPDDVAQRVAQVAVDQVGGRIPVYVGVGDTGLARTLARAERLAAAGADYLVVTAPSTTRSPRRPGSSSTSSPSRTGRRRRSSSTTSRRTPTCRWPVGRRAARGAPEHRRDQGLRRRLVRLRAVPRPPVRRLQPVAGPGALAAISLWSGADGVISAMGNFAPRLLQELAASVREERPRQEILALQARVGELAAVFEQGDWLAGLKATLQALGWEVGEPGAPIPPYDAGQRRVVGEIVATPELRPWLTLAPGVPGVALPSRDEGIGP